MHPWFPKLMRGGLLALAAVMAALVAARMLSGPYQFGLVSVTIPLNPEGFLGVAITLLLLARANASVADAGGGRWMPAGCVFVAAASLFALRRALGIYFLSDDFAVVKVAYEWTFNTFRYIATHGGGDGFYRPVTFTSLALDAKLGGLNPVVWHALSLAIHTGNAVLVMLLARRLGASVFAAGFAGTLFAVHGIHPEAAVWIDGRFDLLSTLFLLSGLLLSCSKNAVGFMRHAAALLCFSLAAYSKEAAFVFPLLVAAWVIWKRQSLRLTIPYFVLAAILFAYRWSLFGGIGGYVDRATGRPAALSLGLGSTIKAVAVRLWTSLYFPLNWTSDPSLPLALLAVVYMAALIWMAVDSRPTGALRAAALALVISVLPVLSLLAGSPTLAGSRVLYLPSVWFAILIGLAADGLAARSRYATAVIVLVFQFAALQHNLNFWEAVSTRVKAACMAGSLVLPDWMDGVPAQANGKLECIEIGRLTANRP